MAYKKEKQMTDFKPFKRKELEILTLEGLREQKIRDITTNELMLVVLKSKLRKAKGEEFSVVRTQIKQREAISLDHEEELKMVEDMLKEVKKSAE